MIWIAVSAVVVALWCFIGSAVRPLYARLGDGASTTTGGAAAPKDYTSWLLGLSALVAFLALPGGGIWVGCVAIGVGVTRWLLRRAAYERRRKDGRDQVIRGCGILAGQLAIGELPATAVKVTASETALFAPVAAAVDVGGDPVAAFRLIAQQPGCEALTQLADGWQVCLRTGMPLSDTVQVAVTNVEREVEREATREAELASARTTGRMLAALPLVGMLMGFTVGADPFAFITGSVFGQLCLFGACCLAGGGLIWTELLSDPSRSAVAIQQQGRPRVSFRGAGESFWLAVVSAIERRSAGSRGPVEPPGAAALERAGFASALELLAAVVHSGAALRSATATVGGVVAGPVGRRLREIQALTDIGLGDAAAWRSLRDHPLWGEVARQLAHCADSGAGLGLVLRRAASRHRDRMAADMMVQARRIGAKSALPLVACYLPAFLLVGVLPIIGSLATQYLR
jgi:tight adherence protein B